MRGLKKRRKGLFSLGNLTILLAVLLFFLRQGIQENPEFLERLYPVSWNQKIVEVLSQLTGIVPFSVGELFLYFNLTIGIFFVLIFLVKIFKGGLWSHLHRGLIYGAVLFIVFMVTFGFNYERESIRKVFSLEEQKYGVEELYALNAKLIDEANSFREGVAEDNKGVFQLEGSDQDVLQASKEAYLRIQLDYPMFKGDYGQPKGIFASELLNYTGITGIFMPFTGEANVNVRGPDLFFPSTILHEMAHQRCVAYEGEANYVAYRTSLYHPESAFKYSGTMLALIKSMNALYREDKTLYRELRAKYSEGMERDLAAYSEFYKAYEGKVNEQATKVNDTYLKSNGQTQGVKTYEDMVNLLLEEFMQKEKMTKKE